MLIHTGLGIRRADAKFITMGQELGLGVPQGVICWAHKIIDHRSITLLLMARGHTTSWEQTLPLHYGEACPLASQPVSQLASNSPSEYTSHHTQT